MSESAVVATARGCAAGAFTAALALAAHTLAGGAAPTGGSLALLVVLACTTGTFAGSSARISGFGALLAVLAAGQGLGHLALAAGHTHGDTSTALPTAFMALAHVVAVAVGAGLIWVCDRLCAALCSVLRGCIRHPGIRPITAAVPVIRVDHPLRRVQLIAASISRRGPPVSVLS